RRVVWLRSLRTLGRAGAASAGRGCHQDDTYRQKQFSERAIHNSPQGIAGFAIPGKPEALARAPLLALRAVVYVRLLLAFALTTGGHMNISICRRRHVRMMIVLRIRRMRLR